LNIAAMIRREVGSPGEARDLAAEALESSTTPEGEVEGEPAANALLGLAESALNDGDEATAAAHLGAIDPLLTDQVGFAWRIELRRLDLACRMDRSRRDELLELSRRYGAVKYEAIALGYLGVEADAVELARQTGSRWLVARVAPEPVARAAADDVASGLPEPLRTSFVAGAPVMVRWSRPCAAAPGAVRCSAIRGCKAVAISAATVGA
jgi:hypothetical protein